MNVKHYFVNDMKEAMEKIKNELGPDAMILSQRTVRRKGLFKWFAKPQLEVIVAWEPPKKSTSKTLSAPIPKSREPLKTNAPERTDKPEALPAQFEPLKTFNPAVFEEIKTNKPAAPAENALSIKQSLTDVVAATDKNKLIDSLKSIKAEKSQTENLEDKMAEMQSLLKNISLKLDSPESKSAVLAEFTDEITILYKKLIENEVHPDIAHGLATETQERVKKHSANPTDVMRQLIAESLDEPVLIKIKRFQRNVILFIGPTGVGKTTSLVKLAALYAYKQKLKVGMINNDTYRVAAHEQLKTYAEILENPITMTYSPEEVKNALDDYESLDIVFIDTSGRSPSDPRHKEDVTNLLETCKPDEIFLVISASTGIRACKEIIEQHKFLNKYNILITKTDESPGLGMILNAKVFSGMPISYMTTGQSVPDDIKEIDIQQVIDRIIN